jgi:hypothetical protein
MKKVAQGKGRSKKGGKPGKKFAGKHGKSSFMNKRPTNARNNNKSDSKFDTKKKNQPIAKNKKVTNGIFIKSSVPTHKKQRLE